MLLKHDKIKYDEDIALEGYDTSVLNILKHYATGKKKVACVEFGKGNGKLIPWLEEIKGVNAVALEDWNQVIFQGDRSLYEDVDVVSWNAFGQEALDETYDVIYASLPIAIPKFNNILFQDRLDKAFEHLRNMLNEDGLLITADYNAGTIKKAVASIVVPPLEIMPYIQTNLDTTDDNPEYFLCVIYNTDGSTATTYDAEELKETLAEFSLADLTQWHTVLNNIVKDLLKEPEFKKGGFVYKHVAGGNPDPIRAVQSAVDRMRELHNIEDNQFGPLCDQLLTELSRLCKS